MLDRSYRLLNLVASKAQRILDVAVRAVAEIPVILYQREWANRATFESFRRVERYDQPETQFSGLYPYERRMLARYFPPAPARLLAHGVGGGRELLALVKAGYSVEAYETCGELGTAAGLLIRACGGGPVRPLSAQEWALAPTGHFDGVFTGWGMWGHVMEMGERVAVLSAFRQVCPAGPGERPVPG